MVAMSLNKKAVLRELSHLPIVGKWARQKYFDGVLNDLDIIQKGFSSAKVRFVDSMRLLYDALQDATVYSFNEDFDWLHTLESSFYTRTSNDGLRLLELLLKGNAVDVEDYFRSFNVGLRINFMSWYSSGYSLEEFYALGTSVVGMYVDDNSQELPPGQLTRRKTRSYNPPLDGFLSSKHFKLLADDLIAVARLIVQSNVRVLNGEEKGPAGKSA